MTNLNYLYGEKTSLKDKITVGELTEYWSQEQIDRESFNSREQLLYDNVLKNSSDHSTKYFNSGRDTEEYLRKQSLLHDTLVAVEDREVDPEEAYDEAVDIISSYAPDMNINRQLGELREKFGGKTRFEVLDDLDDDIAVFGENYPGTESNESEKWLESNGVRGFADLVELDNGFKVREFKTGKKRDRDRFQAATYGLLASIQAGEQVDAEVVYVPEYETADVDSDMMYDVVDTWQSMRNDIQEIRAGVQNNLQRHFGFVDAPNLEDAVRLLKKDNDEEEVQEALETLAEHEVRMNQ